MTGFLRHGVTRAGPGRAEAFLLNPQPLPARTAYEWGVVAEVVANGNGEVSARIPGTGRFVACRYKSASSRARAIQPLKAHRPRSWLRTIPRRSENVAAKIEKIEEAQAPPRYAPFLRWSRIWNGVSVRAEQAGNGLSKLFLTIAAAFAEAERDRIRERIGQVKADQKARGRYLGGKIRSGSVAATPASWSVMRPSNKPFGKSVRVAPQTPASPTSSAMRAWRTS